MNREWPLCWINDEGEMKLRRWTSIHIEDDTRVYSISHKLILKKKKSKQKRQKKKHVVDEGSFFNRNPTFVRHFVKRGRECVYEREKKG